jgi:cobalt/nickel transport system permease protein
MHLGDGAITPQCVALTWGAAAAGLTMAGGYLWRSQARRESLSAEKLQLAAALGCAVFAAQAINVPIASTTSAHLVGSVLLAWTLGPALGAWTMAAVLAAQALLLGDGGVAALGANVINMALLPAAIVAIGKRFNSSISGAGAMAGFAVALAAGLIVVETALFRPLEDLAAWPAFAALMLGTHVWIGLLEGTLTFAVLALARQCAVRGPKPIVAWPAMMMAAAALLVAALVLPISSSLPDGYEAAAQASGISWLLGR